MLKVNGRPVDLELLTALDILLDTANVTQAAERLGLSQPAVSRILGRLRRDFGDPLLVRSGASFRRTPRAESLVAPVALLLEQARALYDPPRFDPATAERSFRLAVPDPVAATLLPRLLPLLEEQAPCCRLDVVPVTDGGASEADLVLAPEADGVRGWRREALSSDVLVLAFGTGLSITDLRDARVVLALPHVAVIGAGQSEDSVDRWLAEQGLERRITATVSHHLQAMHLVARSATVAVLPSRLVNSLHKSLGLGRAELPIAQAPVRYWLHHPPEHEAEPWSIWLRGLVKQAADF